MMPLSLAHSLRITQALALLVTMGALAPTAPHVGARALQESVPADWIGERWPQLVAIEALVGQGDAARARAELAAFAAGGLEERVGAEPSERRVAFALRVDRTARSLGMLDVQTLAREFVVTELTQVLPAGHEKLQSARLNLAVVLHTAGDFVRARALLEAVHALRERTLPADHPDLLRVRQNLAATLQAQGEIDAAHAHFVAILEARSRSLPPDHADLLRAQQNVAVTSKLRGEPLVALELEERVLAGFQRTLPEAHAEVARARLNLGATLGALGRHAEALAMLEPALLVLTRTLPPDHPELLALRSNVALLRRELGDLETARAELESILALWTSAAAAEHPARLAAQQNLAGILLALGELAGARELIEDVVAVRTRVLPPDHPDRLSVELDLGRLRLRQGDPRGALDLFERVHAVQRATWSDRDRQVLATYESLAGARHALGDVAGARELYEHVHAVRRADLPEDRAGLFRSALNASTVLRTDGDLEGAAVLLDEALVLARELLPASHPDVLAAEASWARLALQRGDVAGALAATTSVRAAWSQSLPPGHHQRLRLEWLHVVALDAAGEHDAALEAARALNALCAEVRASDDPLRSEVLVTLAQLCAQRGLHGEVRRLAAEGLAAPRDLVRSLARGSRRAARSMAAIELERLERWLVLGDLAELEGEAPLTRELFAALEGLRHAATDLARTERRVDADPALADVRARLERTRRELADASLTAPTDRAALDAWRQRLIGLAERRDALERELAEVGARLASAREGVDPLAVAASLPVDEALVSYWRHGSVAGEVLTAFVVHAGRVERVGLGPVAFLESRLADWRSAIGAPIERGLGQADEADDAEFAAARALRASLVDPCLAALDGAAVRILHVVPDDLVHLVPLDALATASRVPLGDTLAIRVETSLGALAAPSRASATSGPLVAFGGIDFDAGADGAAVARLATPPVLDRAGRPGTFAPLLSSRFEAEYVGELYREATGREPSVHLRANATESVLAQLAPTARHLHIATHGWFAPESAAVSLLDRVGGHDEALRVAVDRAQETVVGFLPETLCGLALAGANHGPEGILTAEELATLDLTNCELAVLSACETNVGIRRAGQGIQSLQTALHAAGARTAITSLWKVDDAATRRLFELFYTKLWSENLGPADALWQAKMALRSEGHPTRDWAGWVLTGAPD
jgi:CHAT domain-containing protein